MSEVVWPDRTWTNKREKLYVNLVIEEMKKLFGAGPLPEGFSFSEESWEKISKKFNELQNIRFDVAELKWCFQGLKKRYETVAPVYDYGWDCKNTTRLFYHSDWHEMIEDNPELEPYRKHGCPLYIELYSIFGPYRTRIYDSWEGEYDFQQSKSTNIAPESSETQLQSEATSSGLQKASSQVRSEGIWPDKVWTKKREKIFVNLVVEEMKKIFGPFPESFSFSNESWEKIHQRFNETQKVSFDVPELKKRFDVLKKRHEIVAPLYEGDYGWDRKRKMVFVHNSDWKQLIKDTPEIEPYQKHGYPLYVELTSIFGPHRPWEYDSSENEVDTMLYRATNIAPRRRKQKQLQPESPSFGPNRPPSRAMFEEIWPDHIWTNKREKIFVELIVSEMFVFRSKSIEQSWESIRQEFNETQNVNFEVEEFKRRLALLKKRFRIVEPLYDFTDNFFWDHTRKMVDISYLDWEKITEVTPELKFYPKYKCPLYDQLMRIFTEGLAGGFSAEVREIGIQPHRGKEFARDISKKWLQTDAPSSYPQKKNHTDANEFPSHSVAQPVAHLTLTFSDKWSAMYQIPTLSRNQFDQD